MTDKVFTHDALLERIEVVKPTFEEIYADWFHEISRWCRALGGLQADLDDLTQDVFLVVRRKLVDFDGAHLRAWLYRITRRTVRDYRRRAWFRRFLNRDEPTPDEVEHSLQLESDDPSVAFERREAARTLGKLLDRLSEKRRATFILFEIEGYSGEEIASLEGIPLNTVWTRLHHARRDFFALVAKERAEARS